MKNKLLPTFALLLTTILSACGQQATQTPPQPAASPQAIVQPTQAAAPTVTSVLPSTDSAPTAAGISFSNQVMPIFENQCNKCHGIEDVKEGLDMTTYEGLMAGSFNGTVIEPGNAADSFLVQQIENGKMPKRGPKLSPDEIQIIIDWVNAGAVKN